MQFKQEEQQGSQAMESPPQQASILHQYPVMGPRRWTGGGRPSSPGPALYDLHNNNSGSEGSQLSHGGASPAATTAAAAPANGDASSWEVRAFAEDSASCSGQWPPRSYACSFCRREFRTAQALGGHMNVHRRERAQANNMAILRSSSQQAASAATAGPPMPQLAAVGPQGKWCLYSPPIGVGVNPASIAASTERRAFFYSSLAPGGAIIAMTNSSGGSSQFTSSSSPSQYKKVAGSMENHNNNTGNVFCSTQIPSSPFSTSPLSSPISQNSRSSGSSVVTKSGSGSKGEAGPYRSTSSASGDSPTFAQKLQVGAFQRYQASPFAHEAAPLVTQELIQLRPQHHTSTLFSKSMVIRGPADDVGFLDLELRLGRA